MPHSDGTGPHGEGPMTGHGRGYCIIPLQEAKPFFGIGQGGRPRGGGRGRRFGGGRHVHFGRASKVNNP